MPIRLKIPPILLEGDEPSAAPPGTVALLGGRRGPIPLESWQPSPTPAAQPGPAEPLERGEPELPEAYGTGRLFLAARDPRCLYAHWDLTAEQQRRYLSLSARRHLSVRVFHGSAVGQQVAEVHVHPESRSWFLHVDHPSQVYVAELGYHQPDGQWCSVALSEPAATPAEAGSQEVGVQFATISFEPAQPVAALPGPAAQVRMPLVLQVQPMAEQAAPLQPLSNCPAPAPQSPLRQPEVLQGPWPNQGRLQLSEVSLEAGDWTAAHEEALAELIGLAVRRQDWPGSAEIAELLSRQPARALSSAAAAQFGPGPGEGGAISSPAGGGIGGVSSPTGGEMPHQKNFWFNVNAELVIYGATEPDATVSIGGREIRLRPDGTFSYRFALPDGLYALPVSAVATHGDTRRAELWFQRATDYSGDVGAHPQDPALKPPLPESLV